MAIDLGTARGKIEIDASGVYKGMQDAGRSIKSFQSGAALAMVGVTTAIGAVTAAAALMKKGWETLERGTELTAIEGKFERLADSIGSSGDVLLNRLEGATNGMMTNAQLMESATDIMSLGLGKTEDQTVRLATVVGKLGWDMQQTVLTFANNSKLRLDALGLSLDDVNKRTAALREQGMSLDEAFDLAVIEAGEAKIQLLGDQSQMSAGKIKIMKAAVQEVQDEFARGAAEGFASTLDSMSGDVTTVAEGFAQMAYGVGLMTRYLPDAASGFQKLMGVIAPWANTLLEIATAVGVVAGTEMAEDVQFDRGIASADRAMLAYAESVSEADEETEAFGREALNVNAHLRVAGERFKEAAVGSGKLGSQLDSLQEKAAAAQEALDAAAARADAYAAAFGAVQGDYTTPLPDADEPLITPEREVSVVTRISGPTEEQAALAARYTDELERLRETYTELTGGVGTFGMEQEKLDERIAATAGEIAYYEGLLAGIPPAVDSVSTSQQGLAVNVDAARQGIYDQLVQLGAAPEVITAYAAATGIMSAAQAEAVLQAAAVKVKIEELAVAIAAGMPIDEALADLDAFISKIETGALPAADTLATNVPLALAPMSEELSTQAVAAGEVIPTAIAEGVTTTLSEAESAAVDVADAVMLAWSDTVTAKTPDAAAVMEAASVAAIDAWQPAVDDADEIGAAMVDGVIAGAEAGRGALEAKMMEIARAAYQAAMTELDAASPSQLFIDMGADVIIGAIVLGLDEEKDTLYDKMAEIASELYRVATAGLSWLEDPLQLQLRGENEAVGRLGQQIEDALAPFGTLGLRLPGGVVGRLAGMDADGQRTALYALRYGDEYQQSGVVRDEVERLITLADERAAAEQAVLDIQEQLADVEERRLALEQEQARLNFLQSQIDLVNTIRELGLSTSILEGLELGLDANAEDLIEAMRRVVAQLIDAAEDELEIASPSRVGYGLMANFMESMTSGIDANADGPIAALADTYQAMRTLSERVMQSGLTPYGSDLAAMWLAGGGAGGTGGAAGAAELKQNVTIYGGLNVSQTGQATADPLRDLFFAKLGYQRG